MSIRLKSQAISKEIKSIQKLPNPLVTILEEDVELPRRDFRKKLLNEGNDPLYQTKLMIQEGFLTSVAPGIYRVTPKGSVAGKFKRQIFMSKGRTLHRGHVGILLELSKSPKDDDALSKYLCKEISTIRNDLSELMLEGLVANRALSIKDPRRKIYFLSDKGAQVLPYYLALKISEDNVKPLLISPKDWAYHIKWEYPQYDKPALIKLIYKSEQHIRSLPSRNKYPNLLRISRFEWWPGKTMFREFENITTIKLNFPIKILNSFEPLKPMQSDELDIVTMGIETLQHITENQSVKDLSIIALIHFENGFPLLSLKFGEKNKRKIVFFEQSLAEDRIADMMTKRFNADVLRSGINSHEEVVKVLIEGEASIFPARHPIKQLWEASIEDVNFLGYIPFDMVLVTDQKIINDKSYVISEFLRLLPYALSQFNNPQFHRESALNYVLTTNPYAKEKKRHDSQSANHSLSKVFELITKESEGERENFTMRPKKKTLENVVNVKHV